MQHLKLNAKRIIYLLAKGKRQLRDMGGELKKGRNGINQNVLDLKILRRLIKKELVARSEFGDGYYLTDEGKKIAKSIVDEIDEYKRW